MHRRSSDMRRSSDRTRSPPPNPNVFDDEYALDPAEEEDFMAMPVADGRRPAGWNTNSRLSQDHAGDLSPPPRPPLASANSADSTDLRRLASHNSTAKVPYGRDSMSQDTRSSGLYHTRGPSSTGATLRRQASVSSNASLSTMAASDDPFGNGPSHPYGMYPQNPMGRTESVRTSSTYTRSTRPLSPQGPAHPYSMYPQNVMEDAPPMPPVQPVIPVGFPGLAAGYHRRQGPDGEEQDIIGPDGHVEQLPPYSRYPEEGPTKASLAAQESATPRIAPIVPIVTLSGQSSETLNPSPISPLSPPDSLFPVRHETEDSSAPALAPQQASGALPPARPDAASLSASEQGSFEKKEVADDAKSWRNKRLWGRIPCWIVIIFIVLLVVFAVTLGAALGTLLTKRQGKGHEDGRNHKDKHHDEASPQVTGNHNTLFDATPIPTPTNLAPLPTGVFALPLGIAQESSKNCLTILNQLPAWSCKMTFAPLVLSINYTDTEITHPVASVGVPVASTTPEAPIGPQYGIQPPILGENQMQLVLDLDFPRYGPAYHFSSNYDKLVILSQDEFTAGAAFAPAWKRDFGGDFGGDRGRDRGGDRDGRDSSDKPPFRHRFQIQPGDTPWYCYWNQTYIEGYIYVQDNSTAAQFTNFPTAWPSSTSSSVPAETPLETGSPLPSSENAPSSPTESIPPTPSPSSKRKRGDPPSGPGPSGSRDSESKRFVPYPRIVKIEERRLPDAPRPYCQMMRLQDDLTAVPAYDGTGSIIRVDLIEEDPPLADFYKDDSAAATSSAVAAIKRHEAELRARGDPVDACHCQWMFQ